MTARLITHPDVALRTARVLNTLLEAGVDVEPSGTGADGAGDGRSAVPTEDGVPSAADPLSALRAGWVDLALVGIQALRGSAADDLTTVAVLPREEVRDVLVALSGGARTLQDLAPGARVGVVGTRRRAFLRAHRPDVEAVGLPARVLEPGAEVRSEDGGELDAVVVSAFEARHAGLAEATVEALDARAWLPEPGQGVVALVARHPIAEATALDHLPTRTALRAELALLEALEAGRDAPFGCVAQPSGRWIRLWAAAASEDGTRLVRSDRTGPLDEAEALGDAVAREMRARGYGLVVAAAGQPEENGA